MSAIVHPGAVLLASAARWISGAEVRWLWRPVEARPRIFFANHTSHLDTLVIWSALPARLRENTHPVAAQDYGGRFPWRRFIARAMFRSVLIPRLAGIFGGRVILAPLLRELDCGGSLILFPEGTRGTGPEIGEFKSGLFHLLRAQPETEAIPAYIENLNRVMPKGEVLPVPLLCSVAFGAPLKLEPAEGKEPFLARARAAIQALADAK